MGGDTKAWKESNPERAAEHARRYAKRHSPEIVRRVKAWIVSHPESKLLTLAKQRAKRFGLPFSIEVADIVIPDRCPVLGIKLTTSGPRTDGTASIDRIVPALGYVRGNIAVISWRANTLKNSGTAEEHERIAAWIRSVTSKETHYV